MVESMCMCMCMYVWVRACERERERVGTITNPSFFHALLIWVPITLTVHINYFP